MDLVSLFALSPLTPLLLALPRSSRPSLSPLAFLPRPRSWGDLHPASVDGSRKLGWRPIILAARFGDKCLIELLLKHGANPDLPAPRDAPCYACKASRCTGTLNRGSRALHYAVRAQHIGIIKTLLLAGADPNVADSGGITPLMAACDLEGITPLVTPNVVVGIGVKELLEAGADPTRTSKPDGGVALWAAAFAGSTDLVGMLLSRAPGTLNHTNREGSTPLYSASVGGNVDVVAFLLAAGAQQPTTYESTVCPLNASVQEGRVEVVRMLLGSGLEVIGGAVTIPTAVATAVHTGRAGILQMVLDAVHEEGRPESWATCHVSNQPLVCCAVANCHLAALSVLLAAGADAMATDPKGKCAHDFLPRPSLGGSPATRAAFHRMLERAPAFRCHLWAWPVDAAIVGGACASSCVDGVIGPGERRAPLGVRIVRPKHRKLFARVIRGKRTLAGTTW